MPVPSAGNRRAGHTPWQRPPGPPGLAGPVAPCQAAAARPAITQQGHWRMDQFSLLLSTPLPVLF